MQIDAIQPERKPWIRYIDCCLTMTETSEYDNHLSTEDFFWMNMFCSAFVNRYLSKLTGQPLIGDLEEDEK